MPDKKIIFHLVRHMSGETDDDGRMKSTGSGRYFDGISGINSVELAFMMNRSYNGKLRLQSKISDQRIAGKKGIDYTVKGSSSGEKYKS